MNTLLKVLAITLVIAGIIISMLTLNWHGQVAQAPTPHPSISPTPEQSSTIRVTSPQPHSIVTSPLKISGEAQGTWFFEASFPIHLEDASGKTIASTTAKAQGDWMTTQFVQFQATLPMPQSFNGSAVLVLEKDNPSGLSQNAETLKIPVTVKK